MLLSGIILLLFAACSDEDDDGNAPSVKPPPGHYDLRDFGQMTAVRNQNGFKANGMSDLSTTVGLCWAFASLASLESNMLKQGIHHDPLSPEASYSPWYLGNYIGYNKPYYAFNADTIPGLVPVSNFGYYAPGYGWGGEGCFWTANYLTAGHELPNWDACPMPNNEQTEQRTLTPPPPQQAEKINIAEMTVIMADDFNSPEDYRNAVKNYILTNGAIQSMVHIEGIDYQGMISQTTNDITYYGYRFMDKKNFNMFTWEIENLSTSFLTHAVCTAGWDDKRSLDIGGHKTTGAWLIKDSQSKANWNEGYFWVAYEDLAANIIAAGLAACKNKNYKHQSTYQTHPGQLTKITDDFQTTEENCLEIGAYGYLLNGESSGTSWAFVEFPMTQNEKLAAVGIFCSNRNTEITIKAYKNTFENPALTIQNFKLDHVGYFMLELDTEIGFAEGETMIIGAGFAQNAGSNRLPLTYVHDEEYDFNYPSYYGSENGNSYQLTPYNNINPHCGYFMQAIVLK